ncbi:MAG: NAD(P)-dependent oxidoreductase [Myxococcota bacterium]
MRVLVADKLASFVPGRLQDTGAQVTVDPAAKDAALTARVAELDPEVLVVRSTKVTAADIAAGKNLALIIRAGAGVNTIDLAAASSRGVYVANCPGKNAVAVAELAIGHLVNLDRRIADNVASLRAGKWDKKTFGVARGLRGRTLAVLGTGQIGREVIVRAQAFGMRIVAWSRSLTDAEAELLRVERAPTIEAAVANADAVSIHLALAKETRGRIGESVFAAMKPGAYFINTSRAEVVDQDALIRAITTKNLRAGLDVFANEPSAAAGPFADAIVESPNVYGTHHIGASTDESEEAVGEEVVRIVAAYKAGAAIPNVVNLATRSPATHLLVVRHADRVGVLASVLGVLREASINIEDMQNIVFSGGDAACARIGMVGALAPEAVARLESEAHIFSVSQVPVTP